MDSNAQYVIGLNRIIDMSFTWFNINAKYNNQLIRYSSDGGKTFSDITFPGGVWDYKDINQHIQEETVIKQSGKDDEFPISLTFNSVTFRVLIVMKENYQLDLTLSNFKRWSLNIHCDLISESLVDGEDTDIIYSFSTSVLRPSYSFTLEPIFKLFSPVNKNTIDSIRIRITDGKRRKVNLNGADTAFSLILKRI